MKFLPAYKQNIYLKLIFSLIKNKNFNSYQAVESMRNGMAPKEAANDAINRILKHYNEFMGAILVLDKYGNHGKLF